LNGPKDGEFDMNAINFLYKVMNAMQGDPDKLENWKICSIMHYNPVGKWLKNTNNGGVYL